MDVTSNGKDRPRILSSAPRATGNLDEVYASNGLDRYILNHRGGVLPAGARIYLRGWAANADGTGTAAALCAELDDAPIAVRYGDGRVDVASAYSRQEMWPTGFRIVVDTGALQPGAHGVRIYTRDEDASAPPRDLDRVEFVIIANDRTSFHHQIATDLFEAHVDAFHPETMHAGYSPRIERPLLLVASGRVWERASRDRAARIYGVVDGGNPIEGQIGLVDRVASMGYVGFRLCVPTRNLTFGEHDLDIIATTADDRMEIVARRTFTVTPLCCLSRYPTSQPAVARAQIAWSDEPETDVHLARRVRADETGFVNGWALDPIEADAAGSAYLTFGDGRKIELRTRQLREDVAEAPPGGRFCGFVGAIAFAAFEPGRHLGRVEIVSKDAQRLHETTASIAFEVTRPAQA